MLGEEKSKYAILKEERKKATRHNKFSDSLLQKFVYMKLSNVKLSEIKTRIEQLQYNK